MQVDMTVRRVTDEERQREALALAARSRELLATSRAHREYVDRTLAEALYEIRRVLLQIRRGY